MTRDVQWGHLVLAHLHVGPLGAGKHPAQGASLGTAAPARAHPRPMASWREGQLPLCKTQNVFWVLDDTTARVSSWPFSIPKRPQMGLQSLPGALCRGKEVPAGSAPLPLLDSSSEPPSKGPLQDPQSPCPSLLAKAWDGGYIRAPAPECVDSANIDIK